MNAKKFYTTENNQFLRSKDDIIHHKKLNEIKNRKNVFTKCLENNEVPIIKRTLVTNTNLTRNFMIEKVNKYLGERLFQISTRNNVINI
jgi:hypothetical protein